MWMMKDARQVASGRDERPPDRERAQLTEALLHGGAGGRADVAGARRERCEVGADGAHDPLQLLRGKSSDDDVDHLRCSSLDLRNMTAASSGRCFRS